MKKRVGILLVALVLAFSMISCGGNRLAPPEMSSAENDSWMEENRNTKETDYKTVPEKEASAGNEVDLEIIAEDTSEKDEKASKPETEKMADVQADGSKQEPEKTPKPETDQIPEKILETQDKQEPEKKPEADKNKKPEKKLEADKDKKPEKKPEKKSETDKNKKPAKKPEADKNKEPEKKPERKPEKNQKPVEPEDVVVDETKDQVCYLKISCVNILDHMDELTEGKESLVPSDGIILKQQEVVFYEGESVFQVLARVTREKKIHMEYADTPAYHSAYIEGINNLYEFDCGTGSGWMYCVNGWYPNYGCSRYAVKDGDVIEWNYTCDLGNDLGQTWMD